MELLLYIILFFFIYWGIRGAIKLFVIFKQIHKVKKQFDDLNKQWNGNNPFGDNAQGRPEDEITRRIFTQDEGEYVDFEEVE